MRRRTGLALALAVLSLLTNFDTASSTALPNVRGAEGHHPNAALQSSAAVKIREVKLKMEEPVYKMDMMSWVHGHTVQVGNVSELELKVIVNSLKINPRPEYSKYPRVKVFKYLFEDKIAGDELSREVLLYIDPEEKKQWIVNIEDLDLRQNLIVFRLGDLGFGFPRENTYVVLRKTMAQEDPFHYLHLAYLSQHNKGKGVMHVEWDNITPKDMLPIPLPYQEPKDTHAKHCQAPICDLPEIIFGTCPIKRLSCDDLRNMPIFGRDKERMDALIREGQPFLFELAKSASVNEQYMQKREKRERKRSLVNGIGHHSVKKDNSAVVGDPKAGGEIGNPRFIRGDDDEDTSDEEVPTATEAGQISTTIKPETTTENTVKSEVKSSSVTEVEVEITTVKVKTTTEEVASTTVEIPNTKVEVTRATVEVEGVDKTTVVNIVEEINKSGGGSPRGGPKKHKKKESGSYFENILEKIKNSPPGKYTARPLECIGCERLGNFFSEFEQTALTTYVANNVVHDIFNNISSAVFSPEAEEILKRHKRLPYIGYGQCLYSVGKIGQPPKSTEWDDLIDYYSETLQANCDGNDCESQRVKTRLRELLTSKYHLLEVWPDKTIRVNKASTLPQSHTLTTKEFHQFMVSLLLSTYTSEYRLHLLEKITPNQLEFPKNQSLRMQFQTKIILGVLDELIRTYPLHVIKGARYLLQLLQDKYLALVTEYAAIVRFEFEDDSDKHRFKVMNREDRLRALALKDFIINGAGLLTKSGEAAFTTFTTFYNQNKERIASKFVEFGVDRRMNKLNRRSRDGDDYEMDLLKKVGMMDEEIPGDISKQATVFKHAIELDDNEGPQG